MPSELADSISISDLLKRKKKYICKKHSPGFPPCDIESSRQVHISYSIGKWVWLSSLSSLNMVPPILNASFLSLSLRYVLPPMLYCSKCTWMNKHRRTDLWELILTRFTSPIHLVEPALGAILQSHAVFITFNIRGALVSKERAKHCCVFFTFCIHAYMHCLNNKSQKTKAY